MTHWHDLNEAIGHFSWAQWQWLITHVEFHHDNNAPKDDGHHIVVTQPEVHARTQIIADTP